MLTNSWICPQARTAGGLTSSCSVGVTPDGVARGTDVTAVKLKFCTDSDFAPWLWMVLALFAACEDVQSVASSKPRICAGSDRALVVAARSSAGAAPSGAHAARPNAREVSAPKSVTVVVFISWVIRMMSSSCFCGGQTRAWRRRSVRRTPPLRVDGETGAGCLVNHRSLESPRRRIIARAVVFLRTDDKKRKPGFGCRAFFCLVSLIVGAGRFDGCHHRGRLLMLDPRENRGFRVGLPDGRRH